MGLFKKKKADVSNDEVFSLTCEALKEVMPDEAQEIKITQETKIEALGIDSVKYLNLLISFEEIIGKDLEEIVEAIDIQKLVKVSDLVDLIKIHKS